MPSDQSNDDAGQIVTYQEVFDAAESFEEDPRARSLDWKNARKFVDWKKLHNLPTNEIVERVISFLDRWGCYLYTQRENWPKMAERIRDAYRESIPFLNALENETLEDIDLKKKKTVNGDEYTNEYLIERVFARFCQVAYGFRGVAASKTLSLINPHLFVMWDNEIARNYGVKSPSEPSRRDPQYVSLFLPKMKGIANGIIDSYIQEKKCSRKEAIEAINSFRNNRPLAKLIDEYNWMKYAPDTH